MDIIGFSCVNFRSFDIVQNVSFITIPTFVKVPRSQQFIWTRNDSGTLRQKRTRDKHIKIHLTNFATRLKTNKQACFAI